MESGEETAATDGLTTPELEDSRAAWWSGDFTSTLIRRLESARGAGILDVGCGTGILERRLASAESEPWHFTGVDLDLGRVVRASRSSHSSHSSRERYLVANGCTLPFAADSFGASVAVLTLQHVAEPARVLREMARVTRCGGIVLIVEADNLGQKLYVAPEVPELDSAYADFWSRVAATNPGRHLRLGPSLPRLFGEEGFQDVVVSGFLVVHNVVADAAAFFVAASTKLRAFARRYGVAETRELGRLLDALVDAATRCGRAHHPHVLATVPVFLVSGSVRAGG